MSRWLRTLLLSTLAGVALCGCNVVRVTVNTPLTQDDIQFIVPGQTSFSDVITKLGTPDAIVDTETGMVATYRFLDVKYSRINFGWIVKLWSPVDPDLVISRSGLGLDAFEVLCNDHWIVTHHSFLRQLAPPQFNPYPF
ncbi:MAG TPA: hypothetical protein VKP13_10565 [Nitrospira sp.]|nr:hypothetical protein [Nitrospira sp.]